MLGSSKNRAHHFLTDVLQEVYFFDPPGDLGDQVTAAALSWSGGLAQVDASPCTPSRRRMRTPTTRAPGTTSSFREFTRRHRTASVVPIATWKATVESVTSTNHPQWGFQETYQVISAMMLTHAVGTSGF
ncbi:hypothetical protein [Microbacterium lemovicicum]|uniref:hypothetical protein n=1 Tax=Microbacterium lemovicicum TaxID=1072463 RepID=UPI000F8E73D5|nr:hypothetical protein [Microbacterium lemovicicum]